MAYSMDYRKRAVEYKDAGHTFKELEEAFKIPPITYYDWKEKLSGGYYETKPKAERSRKIDKEKLRAVIRLSWITRHFIAKKDYANRQEAKEPVRYFV